MFHGERMLPEQSPATLSPTVAFAKIRYMCDVVSAVPIVERQHLIQVHQPVFWVIELAREIRRRHPA